MRLLLLAFAASLLAASGCASPGPLVLTYRGGEDGRVATELAVQEWRDVCLVDVRLGAGGVPVEDTKEGLNPGEAAAMQPDHEGNPKWIHFSFMPSQDADEKRADIAHEIGHALGLVHVDDDHDLMFHIPYHGHVAAENCARIVR